MSIPHSVTAVVIVHNDSDNTRRCIDSLHSQNNVAVEIFLVGKQDLISKYNERRFEADGELNAIAAVRAVVSELKTEYFMTIDSDDWFPDDMMSTMTSIAEKSNCDCVASSYFALEPKHGRLRKPDEGALKNGSFRFIGELYRTELAVAMSESRPLNPSVCLVDRAIYYHSEGVGQERTKLQSLVKFIDDGVHAVWRLRLIPQRRKYRKKIEFFKDRYAGKRCFIIGNGPSLTMGDLDKLVDEYTFGMNKIFVAFKDTKWRPTFYAIQDAVMIRECSKEVAAVESEYKFIRSNFIGDFKDKPDNLYFYEIELRLYNGKPAEFSEDLSVCAYEGGTVAYLCMQLAMYMGFTEIYLLGIDFTYNIAKTKDGIKFSDVRNYFSTEYEKDGQIFNYSRLDFGEEAFNLAKKVSERRGVKIYNATRGGKLEVFERVDFDSLFR